jgi:hypothetical protein
MAQRHAGNPLEIRPFWSLTPAAVSDLGTCCAAAGLHASSRSLDGRDEASDRASVHHCADPRIRGGAAGRGRGTHGQRRKQQGRTLGVRRRGHVRKLGKVLASGIDRSEVVTSPGASPGTVRVELVLGDARARSLVAAGVPLIEKQVRGTGAQQRMQQQSASGYRVSGRTANPAASVTNTWPPPRTIPAW